MHAFIALSALALLVPLHALAGGTDDAGMVKSVAGSVAIGRGTHTLPALPGTAVKQADIVRTGPSGRVGITLRDNTVLSAGPNSVLSLDKFSFAPKTQKGELQASLKRGSLAAISGSLAKTSPDHVQFRTSTLTLGVRGTSFILETRE